MLPATLALVVVVQGVVAQCGQEGQVPAPCLPRLTSLALDPASWPGHRLLAPRQLEVARCAGSCPHPQHSCRPAQLRRLQLRALLARVAVNHTGVADTECAHVEVEEHVTCECGCPVSPDTCTSEQTFLPFECRCACTNHSARDACLARGWRWGRDTCRCECPGEHLSCPTGHVYDYLATCSCVPSHAAAGVELWAGLGLAAALLLVTLVAASHWADWERRRGHLHKQSSNNNDKH